MKKGDKIVILVILLVSAGLFYFTTRPVKDQKDKYLSVQISGREVDKIPLKANGKREVHPYKTKFGENTVLIENGKVSIAHATCKDQICRHMAPISQVGETIICLPHQFFIEIKAQTKSPDDMDLLLR